MSSLTLTTAVREQLGKMAEYVRQIEVMIPGVVYGGKENLNVKVPKVEFEKLFVQAGESTIVDLTFADGKKIPVLIYDYQRNAVSHAISHIDFYEVDMNKEITASIPLHFVGEAPAIKALAGDLFKGLEELDIRCLPKDLIHSIEVDISVLATFDDAIHVSDLKVPASVKIMAQPGVVVAKVNEHIEEVFEAVVSEADAVAAVEAAVVKPVKEGEEVPAVPAGSAPVTKKAEKK